MRAGGEGVGESGAPAASEQGSPGSESVSRAAFAPELGEGAGESGRDDVPARRRRSPPPPPLSAEPIASAPTYLDDEPTDVVGESVVVGFSLDYLLGEFVST